jgi:hypothetical protein
MMIAVKRDQRGDHAEKNQHQTIVRVPKNEPPLGSSAIYPKERTRDDRGRITEKDARAVSSHGCAAYSVI